MLVIDDDRIPRRMIANAIAKAGGGSVEAEDASSGLALYTAAPTTFDAALVDFNLPGVDGADLVRVMRELGFAGPIIGITETTSEAQVSAWVQAGCDKVFEKDVSMAELVQELAAAYRRCRNRTRFRPRLDGSN